MKILMKVLVPWLLLTVLVGAIFSQEAPTPLTDKEKLQSAELAMLLQDSQRALLSSPQWQMNQQRQREYAVHLRARQAAKGAADNCILTFKQEWNCPAPVITQSTQGANSPNVVGVKGDVNIEIGDKEKEPDVSDPTPTPK